MDFTAMIKSNLLCYLKLSFKSVKKETYASRVTKIKNYHGVLTIKALRKSFKEMVILFRLLQAELKNQNKICFWNKLQLFKIK